MTSLAALAPGARRLNHHKVGPVVLSEACSERRAGNCSERLDHSAHVVHCPLALALRHADHRGRSREERTTISQSHDRPIEARINPHRQHLRQSFPFTLTMKRPPPVIPQSLDAARMPSASSMWIPLLPSMLAFVVTTSRSSVGKHSSI